MAEQSNVAARARVEELPGDRSAESIRRDIATKQGDISETFDRLGDKIEGTLDWRTYVSRHPFVALGVAAAGGLLLSRLFARRPSPSERILDALAETAEEVGDNLRGRVQDALGSRAVAGRAVKAAAAATISRLAVEFVTDRITSANWSSPRYKGVRYGKPS
jgi:ElaB/YqjD/DUF883 family membrane-anchored ribosome-binding protein